MHGLSGNIEAKEEALRQSKNKRGKKSEDGVNSQLRSFQLFQSGKSTSEIAAIRNLAEGTIEGHLAHFVKTGELDLLKLISEEKAMLIKDALEKSTEHGLAALKRSLGDEVSYSEIRFAIASLKKN
jgi:uncharacterized protein YpbB